jgi:hypothetical protein
MLYKLELAAYSAGRRVDDSRNADSSQLRALVLRNGILRNEWSL